MVTITGNLKVFVGDPKVFMDTLKCEIRRAVGKAIGSINERMTRLENAPVESQQHAPNVHRRDRVQSELLPTRRVLDVQTNINEVALACQAYLDRVRKERIERETVEREKIEKEKIGREKVERKY